METTDTMEKPRILLVEDDTNLGSILQDYLNNKGFEVVLARDGEKGWQQFAQREFDCCVLDVMMPEKDGFTLAKEIRGANPAVPIIFLTARKGMDDTVEGFKSGADDYVSKPFSMEELMLRIKAILRRTKGDAKKQTKTVYEIGRLRFDHKNQVLKNGEEVVNLTSKENALLRLLVLHSNDLLDRSLALKAIWGDDSYFNSRSMDVYIAKLRKYLKADEGVKIINEHGKGFKLLLPDDKP